MKKTTIRILTVVPVLVLFLVLYFNNQSLRSQLAVFNAQAEVEAQNKALVWKWYEAKLNQELEKIHDEMLMPGASFHMPDYPPDSLPIEVLFQKFPIKGREEPVVSRPLEPLIADGDRVVFRYVVEAEDKGKEIKVEGISIFRFEEGKIAEGWLLEDSLGKLQQLEVVYGDKKPRNR